MASDDRIPVIEWSPDSGRPMPALYRAQHAIWSQVPEDVMARIAALGLSADFDTRTWMHRGSVPTLARRLVAWRDGLPSAKVAKPTDAEIDAVWAMLDALRRAGYLDAQPSKRGADGLIFSTTSKVRSEFTRKMNQETIENARRTKIPFIIRRWPALDAPCSSHGAPAESASSSSHVWESTELGCDCIFSVDFGEERGHRTYPSTTVSIRSSMWQAEQVVPVRFYAG